MADAARVELARAAIRRQGIRMGTSWARALIDAYEAAGPANVVLTDGAVFAVAKRLHDPECSECDEGIEYEGDEWTVCDVCVLPLRADLARLREDYERVKVERDAAVKALRAVEGMLWEARDEASSGKTANASFIDNRVENALAAARAALSEVQE